MLKYAVLSFNLIACVLCAAIQRCYLVEEVLQEVNSAITEPMLITDNKEKFEIPDLQQSSTSSINQSQMNCSHTAFACFNKQMNILPGTLSMLRLQYNEWFQLCGGIIGSTEESECTRCSKKEKQSITEFLVELRQFLQKLYKT